VWEIYGTSGMDRIDMEKFINELNYRGIK